MDYYVRRGGKVSGPIDQEALHARAGRGAIVESDELSHEAGGPWMTAGAVAWLEFKAATPSPEQMKSLRTWLVLSLCANALLLSVALYAFNRQPRITLTPPGRQPFTVTVTDEFLQRLSIDAGHARDQAERAWQMHVEEQKRLAPEH